jgi:hypothetical protein
MRQIKIQAINFPGKTDYIKFNMYSVSLGNDSRTYFSNLKDAKLFVADTNRFLNLKLHEFNQVFISIFSEYQRNWFYFDSKNGKANKNLSLSEGKITENLQSITKAMNFMVTRSGSPNGNYFTFTNFYNCLDYSLDILETLILKNLKTLLCAVIKETSLHDNKYSSENKKKTDRVFLDRCVHNVARSIHHLLI